MAGELFKAMSGTNIVHVPHRGSGDARTAVMGGHVQMMIDAITTTAPTVQEGQVRALGTTGRKRSRVLPDVPTIAEAGYPGFDLQPWAAMFGPAGLDKTIVASLDKALKQIVATPEVVQRLAQLSMTPAATSPEELATLVEKSITLWKGVAAKAKIVVE
jgi:tripartite-type tricarboxylate transporter receptor subunit TctC